MKVTIEKEVNIKVEQVIRIIKDAEKKTVVAEYVYENTEDMCIAEFTATCLEKHDKDCFAIVVDRFRLGE